MSVPSAEGRKPVQASWSRLVLYRLQQILLIKQFIFVYKTFVQNFMGL